MAPAEQAREVNPFQMGIGINSAFNVDKDFRPVFADVEGSPVPVHPSQADAQPQLPFGTEVEPVRLEKPADPGGDSSDAPAVKGAPAIPTAGGGSKE